MRQPVSVIIPILDSSDPRLQITIDSLDVQCQPGDEVVGVGCYEKATWERNGWFRRSSAGGVLSRAALLNRGVAAARNSVVLVCQPDCPMVPGAVDQARNAVESWPMLGITCFLGRLPTERRLELRKAGHSISPHDLPAVFQMSEDDQQEFTWLGNALAFHKRDLRSAGGFCEEFTGTGHRDGFAHDTLDRLAAVAQQGVRVNRHLKSFHLWHEVSQEDRDLEEKATRLLNMRRLERQESKWAPNQNYRRAV